MSALLDTLPRFRPMREADLDAVLAVENAIYAHPWTRGNFEDSLRAGYGCWMLEWREVLVGYGVLMPGAGETHLLNISVAADWQRQGHGRSLLEFFVARSRELRATALFLEVRPSNRAARALYAANGFREIGRRPRYYPAAGGREDAILMGRQL